jgi:acyl carrier protein
LKLYVLAKISVPPLCPSLTHVVNGKVDISRLVQVVEAMDPEQLLTPSTTPATTSPQSVDSEFGARDYFESTIAALIASTLSVPLSSVSLEASFQELGGSSLDAIVIVSHLRKANIHLNVADILQSGSIRQMATSRQNFSAEPTLIPAPFSLVPKGVNMDFSGTDDVYPATVCTSHSLIVTLFRFDIPRTLTDVV